jgi:cytochrome c-type biogenesis protein CcmH
MKLLVLVFALLAAAATPALASEQRPTLAELESEVICPTCQTTLDQSDAPIARRMKAFIARRIAAGDTKSEIKSQLVAQFGQRVLAAPPKKGFNLLAWLLPIVGISVAAVVIGALAWRWSRTRELESPPPADPSRNGRGPLEPELERRLDDALARFDQ